MTNKEKSALLAAGEKCLAFLERAMKETIKEKDLDLAKVYRNKYEGAVYMLEALELLSHQECENRSNAIFSSFMDAAYPKADPKEAI